MSMGLKLWSKLSRVNLDTLDREQDTLRSDQTHMILKYELFISCTGDGRAWRDVYQFADRPEADIICMLKERTVELYEAIFDQEPISINMGIQIVEPQHRDQLPTLRK